MAAACCFLLDENGSRIQQPRITGDKLEAHVFNTIVKNGGKSTGVFF
jgi:hypothetical protein